MPDLKIICRTCDEPLALGQGFLPAVSFHRYLIFISHQRHIISAIDSVVK